MLSRVRVRIAPSPTGDPHIGTAYSALFNWAFAQKHKGIFILRIEDTDRSRFVEGSEEKILESLRWLGLRYDEGPDIGGPYKPYRQSERKDIYQTHAFELVKKKAAYYCFCSPGRLEKIRNVQQKANLAPRYDRHCRYLSGSEIERSLVEKRAYCIRLAVPEKGETKFTDLVRGEISFANIDIDDQVLLKSDGFPTYHLAAVVDDHLMEISHVIRAEEWISSTPKHVILYDYFGWQPPHFAHLPLLRNPDKSKISKRKNPTSVFWYKDQGYLAEAILNFLCLLGWSHPEGKEIFGLDEFVEKFSLERINPAGPVFNLEKLDWINGGYIRLKSDEELYPLLTPFIPRNWDKKKVAKILPLFKERLKKLSEFKDAADFFFEDIKISLDEVIQKGKTIEQTRSILGKVVALLSGNEVWKSVETLEAALRKFTEEQGWSPKDLFMTLRLVVTGKNATPPLFETMEVLGQTKSLERLTKAINLLK